MNWDSIKIKLREAGVSILYYTGVLSLLKMLFLKDRCVVLMYHRVLSEQESSRSFSHGGIITSLDTFSMHMEYLSKNFHVISHEEFLDCLTLKKSFRRSSCLITFDDGWLDNYMNAYPVLRNYQLPAIIFLPTAFIDSDKRFWQECISYYLFLIYSEKSEQSRRIFDSIGLGNLSEATEALARNEIGGFVAALKGYDKSRRERVISKVSKYVNNNILEELDMDSFISWDQAREMLGNQIEFGAHSKNHCILTKINSKRLLQEVVEPRNEIHARLGVVPRSFCYPNGDHNRCVEEAVFNSGYDASFSTVAGRVKADDPPFSLKRISIHNDMTSSKPMFLARVLGII